MNTDDAAARDGDDAETAAASELARYLDEVDHAIDHVSEGDIEARLQRFKGPASPVPEGVGPPAPAAEPWVGVEMAEEMLRRAQSRALEIELDAMNLREKAVWHLAQAERLQDAIIAQATARIEAAREEAEQIVWRARQRAAVIELDASERAERLLANARTIGRAVARPPSPHQVVVEVRERKGHRPFVILYSGGEHRRHRRRAMSAPPPWRQRGAGAPAGDLELVDLAAERRRVRDGLRESYLWLVDCCHGDRTTARDGYSTELDSKVEARIAEISDLVAGVGDVGPPEIHERLPVFMPAPFEWMPDEKGYGSLVFSERWDPEREGGLAAVP